MRVLLLTGWENCCCPCYSRACNRSCVTVAEAAAAARGAAAHDQRQSPCSDPASASASATSPRPRRLVPVGQAALDGPGEAPCGTREAPCGSKVPLVQCAVQGAVYGVLQGQVHAVV